VDHLLQAEAEYLSRPLRLEAEKVKSDAKSRVTWVNQKTSSPLAAETYLSNEKNPGCLGVKKGVKSYPVVWGV